MALLPRTAQDDASRSSPLKNGAQTKACITCVFRWHKTTVIVYQHNCFCFSVALYSWLDVIVGCLLEATDSDMARLQQPDATVSHVARLVRTLFGAVFIRAFGACLIEWWLRAGISAIEAVSQAVHTESCSYEGLIPYKFCFREALSPSEELYFCSYSPGAGWDGVSVGSRPTPVRSWRPIRKKLSIACFHKPVPFPTIHFWDLSYPGASTSLTTVKLATTYFNQPPD
uniref:Uncharacterized protein n=1 Tax=Panagrellus redivivus TaxID=6233 RepID=A0A7E4ZS66_PANRE